MSESDKRKLSRRNIIKAASGVVGAGFLAGCSGGQDQADGGGTPTATPTATPEPTPTPKPSYQGGIGYVAPDMSVVPVLQAMVNMLPEATNGRFTGTAKQFDKATLAMKSMITRNIPLSTASPGIWGNAIEAGSNVRVIATDNAGTDYVLAVQKGKNINSVSDFANRDLRFGISGKTGIDFVQIAGVLAEKGIPQEKMNFIQVGGSSARTAALSSGRIDGAGIHIPQMERLRNKNAGVKQLFRYSKFFPNLIQDSVVARPGFLKKSPESAWIQAYITQLLKAMKLATNNFETIYKWTQQFQAKTLPREDAKSTWQVLAKEVGSWPYKNNLDRSAYESSLKAMDAAGLINRDAINLDKVLVPKYTDQAEKKI